MKKRIILSSCAVLFAVAGIVGTKANPPLPDYYINNNDQCVESPISNCITGGYGCVRTIVGQGLKQIYDERVDGDCTVPQRLP